MPCCAGPRPPARPPARPTCRHLQPGTSCAVADNATTEPVLSVAVAALAVTPAAQQPHVPAARGLRSRHRLRLLLCQPSWRSPRPLMRRPGTQPLHQQREVSVPVESRSCAEVPGCRGSGRGGASPCAWVSPPGPKHCCQSGTEVRDGSGVHGTKRLGRMHSGGTTSRPPRAAALRGGSRAEGLGSRCGSHCWVSCACAAPKEASIIILSCCWGPAAGEGENWVQG